MTGRVMARAPCRVDLAGGTLGDHLRDHPGDRRHADLLGLREPTHRHRPGEDQHRERGQTRGRDARMDVLAAHAAQHVNGRRVQPVGDVVDVGGRHRFT